MQSQRDVCCSELSLSPSHFFVAGARPGGPPLRGGIVIWLARALRALGARQHPSKHALTGPIQDLNGQVRAIRANLALINPVWDLYGLPVLNPQYHALINPVWDLYVFARMISATTGPYRSCTGSVWVCLNLQQGGSPKRRETHWRRRLAPTLNNNWHGLCFYSLIPR